MQWYEVEACITGLERKNRISWEQTRMNCFFTAQVNSSKKLSPSDIMPFEWDVKQEKNTIMKDEDIERLKEKAKKYLNKNHNG